jgi:sulfur carrier protein
MIRNTCSLYSSPVSRRRTEVASGEAMKITVNGEEIIIAAMSVFDYLKTIDYDPRPIAVELNRGILPKNDYRTTFLMEGDQLEVVWFVGGG